MRYLLIKKVTGSESKISLITNEFTTLRKKSTLVVFAGVFVQEFNLTEAMNLFIEWIELDDVTAHGIFTALISHLESLGTTEELLTENLVSLTCNGAAVMFVSRGGVSKLFKDKFPSIILCHCANHRLELSVHDTIRDVAGTNRFKSFLDRLYVVYHA
jgi:hypothetical protein